MADQWTITDVSKKIRETYNEEIANKFEEQKIDGKALKFLAKEGTSAQFAACGLTTVGDQMKLKEVASQVPLYLNRRKKPTIAEIKSLTDLNQRIYKAKRKAVSKAAMEKWSGNKIPVFKKNKDAIQELDTLVSTLEETCSFEPAGFDGDGIKQHILDVLNERRRRIRNGHDYTQVDKRTIKKPSSSSSTPGTMNEQEAIANSGDTDILPNTDTDDDDESETEEDLSLLSAKVIVTVMFQAIKFADVAKQQLVSATKKFKSMAKFNTSSKDSMALDLAKIFIIKNYVKIKSNDLRNVSRDDVTTLKVF